MMSFVRTLGMERVEGESTRSEESDACYGSMWSARRMSACVCVQSCVSHTDVCDLLYAVYSL